MTVADYVDTDADLEQPTPETLLAATLALEAAIDQLTQPGLERLDRSQAAADEAVAQVAAEAERTAAHERARDQHREHQLLTQLDAARQRDDHVGDIRIAHLRRTLITLRIRMKTADQERARQAEARTAPQAVLPSLLEQLLDAVGSSLRAANGAAGSVHRIPIDPKAAELVAEIERSVNHQPGDTLPDQLRAWAEAHIEHANPTTLPEAALYAERWVKRARDIVTPARIEEVSTDPCPRCGNRWVWVDGDAGETVRKAVLQIRHGRQTPTGQTEGGEVRCVWHSCGARWPQTHWDHLGALIHQKRQERADEEAPPRDKAC